MYGKSCLQYALEERQYGLVVQLIIAGGDFSFYNKLTNQDKNKISKKFKSGDEDYDRIQKQIQACSMKERNKVRSRTQQLHNAVENEQYKRAFFLTLLGAVWSTENKDNKNVFSTFLDRMVTNCKNFSAENQVCSQNVFIIVSSFKSFI